MTKKFKILSLIAIGSGLTLGVTAMAVASPSVFKPLEYRERNAVINSSVTFKNPDSNAVCNASLNLGGTIKAYSTKGLYQGGMEVSTSAYVFIEYVNNGVENKTLKIDDVDRNMAEFQSLTSVKVTHDGNVKVFYSSNGTSWSYITPYSGFKNSSVAGAKYIYFTGTTRTDISQIVLEYSCNSELEPVLNEIVLSGSYQTEFSVGDSFSSSGLVVTANYLYGGESQVVTSEAVITPPDMSTAGSNKTVEVSYTEGGVTKTASYYINVNEAAAGLTGTYSSGYYSIIFTSSTQGTYKYDTVELTFTYALSGASVSFTYASGAGNTDFGSKRLFKGGYSPIVNSTGVVSESQISVSTYNVFDSATTTTFTKVS